MPDKRGVCYHFRYRQHALHHAQQRVHAHGRRTGGSPKTWVRGVIKDHPAEFVVVVEHYQWFFGNDRTHVAVRTLEPPVRRVRRRPGHCRQLNHIYARTNALYQGKETDGRTGTVYLQTPLVRQRARTGPEGVTDNRDLIRFRWSEGPKTVGGLLLQNRGKDTTRHACTTATAKSWTK